VPKRQLKEALTAQAVNLPGVAPTKVFDATLVELRKQGAVTVRYTHPVMRHRPLLNSAQE
jgi:hypothetical protein